MNSSLQLVLACSYKARRKARLYWQTPPANGFRFGKIPIRISVLFRSPFLRQPLIDRAVQQNSEYRFPADTCLGPSRHLTIVLEMQQHRNVSRRMSAFEMKNKQGYSIFQDQGCAY